MSSRIFGGFSWPVMWLEIGRNGRNVPAACASFFSKLARDVGQQLGGAHGFPQRKVGVGGTGARLPAGDDTDTQIGPAFPSTGNQVPSAAVAKADVADENVIGLC